MSPRCARYIRWLLGFEGLAALAVEHGHRRRAAPLARREAARCCDIYADEVGGPAAAARRHQRALHGRSGRAGARCARRAGASGLVIFPIPAFAGEALPPEIPYEYHRAIADAVPLPMVLFQLQPALAGVLFSRETLLRLIEIPTVVAIKEASFDAVRFVETRRILDEAPRRITLLTGNDNFILESFVLGAEGALIGFGTIAIAEQIEMFRLLAAGDIEARVAHQRSRRAAAGRRAVRSARAQLPRAPEGSAAPDGRHPERAHAAAAARSRRRRSAPRSRQRWRRKR